MFVFALLIGIYSYVIFFLGIFGLLYKNIVILWSVLFWIGACIVFWKRLLQSVHSLTMTKGWWVNKQLLLFVILLTLQACVNLIGTLGPELAFDALWYHLTLPKLWLLNHSIEFIPGGLLYYSAMPKLAEMLYIAGLSFGNEITVKLIHYSFGLLTCLALYKLSRKFFTPVISFVAVVIFYTNLVVAWESTTAYIDLTRAFFELMALWAFVNWWEGQKRKWLVFSALMIGFAITTKLLSLGSLVVFTILLFAVGGWQLEKSKSNLLSAIRNVIVYWIIALAVPLPWFVFSYVNTGNLVYPFFTEIYKVTPEPVSVIGFFREVWLLFTHAADPVSPIYLICLPLIVILWGRVGRLKSLWIIGAYSVLAIVVWYFTPRTGGGRFLVPYLPAFSILCAGVLQEVLHNTKKYGVYLGRILLMFVVVVSFISIGYRFVANQRYVPVILGLQTKDAFLSSNLNFAFGDFYDTDGYFKKHIKPTDNVLLYGFHNIYYVNFPFIDASWKKPEDSFNYIATQNTVLPEEFNHWVLIYENEQTMVKLYKEPERLYSQTWLY